MNVRSWLPCVSCCLVLASCQAGNPPPGAKVVGGAATDADVIVVGGGISGIAAALEASDHGARVLVIEANSVAGGHAVKAGGFALVDTPLQRSKGYKDSPDIAYRDLMAWGEDNNPWWTRYYADNALTQVHDWLTGMGVKFVVALDTPEDTVPRFHFTRGGAVNAVVPMIREALKRESIRFAWNTEVVELRRQDGAMTGVRTRDLRSGTEKEYTAPAIVLATGGYQNNLPLVRENFWKFLPQPERLLTGAGEFARGSALKLVEPFGVALSRLDHQVTFVNGLPDPRESGDRGLLTQNPDAIWVDATGRRFTNEAAPSKVTDRAVLKLVPATHWLVFDSIGMKKLTIRGAAWMSDAKVRAEIIDNPQLVKQADSIAALATAAGLPPDALADTVQRFNRFIDQGLDTDFGRIGPGNAQAPPPAIKVPPFYAIRLYPMTRKSMGGISIDHEARALGGAGQVVRGLFAAGEVTGVAGINGSYGGSGTFLGPSVLTGRVAGRSAVSLALGEDALKAAQPAGAAKPEAAPAPLSGIDLPALVKQQRAGYWHFNVSHALVLERGDACATCHTGAWTPGPAVTREQRIVQLDACTKCH